MLGTHTFIGGLKSDKKEGTFVLDATAASWDGGFDGCPASPQRWSLTWLTTPQRGRCVSQGQVSWTVGCGFPYSCPVVTGQ